VNPLLKKDINGGDKRNKHTHSQHTASVSEQHWKHREAVPRQQPTVDSKNSQINAASEHACHTPEGATLRKTTFLCLEPN